MKRPLKNKQNMSRDSDDLLSEDILGNDSSFLESSPQRVSFPPGKQISRPDPNYYHRPRDAQIPGGKQFGSHEEPGMVSKRHGYEDQGIAPPRRRFEGQEGDYNRRRIGSDGLEDQFGEHTDEEDSDEMIDYPNPSPQSRNMRSQSEYVPNDRMRVQGSRHIYTKREPTPTGNQYSPPLQGNLSHSQRHGRSNIPQLKEVTQIRQSDSVRESLSMRGNVAHSQGRFWPTKSREYSSKKDANQEFIQQNQQLRVENEDFNLMDSTMSLQNTLDAGRGTDLMNDTDPSSLQMFAKGPINNTSISNNQEPETPEQLGMSPVGPYGKSGLKHPNVDSPVQTYGMQPPAQYNINQGQRPHPSSTPMDPVNLQRFNPGTPSQPTSTPNIKKKSLIKKMNPGSFKKLKAPHTPNQNIKNNQQGVSEFQLNRNKSMSSVSRVSTKRNKTFVSGKGGKGKTSKRLSKAKQTESNANLRRGGRFSMNRSTNPTNLGDSKRRSLSRKRKDTMESEKFKVTQIKMRRDLDKKGKELRKITTMYDTLKGNYSALKTENGRLQKRIEDVLFKNGKFEKRAKQLEAENKMQEQAMKSLKKRETNLKEQLAQTILQLEQSFGEVKNLQRQARESFRNKIQSQHQRNELSSFKLEPKAPGMRGKSVGEPNLSAVTQNTNYIYSEDVSMKSGFGRNEDRRRTTDPNFGSLEGTVVSTLVETGPKPNSGIKTPGEDQYDPQSLLFSKQKDTPNDPNMTFGGGPDFRFKLSDKKTLKSKCSDSAEQSLSKQNFKDMDLSAPFLVNNTFRKQSNQSLCKGNHTLSSPLDISRNSMPKARGLSFQIKARHETETGNQLNNPISVTSPPQSKNNLIHNVQLKDRKSHSNQYQFMLGLPGQTDLVHTFAALNSAHSKDPNQLSVNSQNVPTFGHSPRAPHLARVSATDLNAQNNVSKKWSIGLGLQVERTKWIFKQNEILKKRMLESFGKFDKLNRKFITALKIMKGIESKYESAAQGNDRYRVVVTGMLEKMSKLGLVEKEDVMRITQNLCLEKNDVENESNSNQENSLKNQDQNFKELQESLDIMFSGKMKEAIQKLLKPQKQPEEARQNEQKRPNDHLKRHVRKHSSVKSYKNHHSPKIEYDPNQRKFHASKSPKLKYLHKRTSSSVKSYQIGKSPKKIYKITDPYGAMNKDTSKGRKSLYSRPKDKESQPQNRFPGFTNILKKNEVVSGGKYGVNLLRNMEGNSDIGDGKSHQVYGEHDSDNGSMNELFESVMSQSGQGLESRDHSSFINPQDRKQFKNKFSIERPQPLKRRFNEYSPENKGPKSPQKLKFGPSKAIQSLYEKKNFGVGGDNSSGRTKDEKKNNSMVSRKRERKSNSGIFDNKSPDGVKTFVERRSQSGWQEQAFGELSKTMDEKKFAEKIAANIEEPSITKIDMIRQFLEVSRARFGMEKKGGQPGKKSEKRVRGKDDKTPPRRPQASKATRDEKEPKMSFGRSGSFNKRNRLLRTEDEAPEKEQSYEEPRLLQTPGFGDKKTQERRVRNPHKTDQFNEYYDEYSANRELDETDSDLQDSLESSMNTDIAETDRFKRRSNGHNNRNAQTPLDGDLKAYQEYLRQRGEESESYTGGDFTSRTEIEQEEDYIGLQKRNGKRNPKNGSPAEHQNQEQNYSNKISAKTEHQDEQRIKPTKRKSEPDPSNKKPKGRDRDTKRNQRAKTSPGRPKDPPAQINEEPTRRRKKTREKSMTERKDFIQKEEGRLHKSNVERNCLTEEMERLHSKHERLRRERQARLAAILIKEESLEEALASELEDERVWVNTEETEEVSQFIEHVRRQDGNPHTGSDHSRSEHSHSPENRRVTNLVTEEEPKSPQIIRKVSTLELSSDKKEPTQEDRRIRRARNGVVSIDRGEQEHSEERHPNGAMAGNDMRYRDDNWGEERVYHESSEYEQEDSNYSDQYYNEDQEEEQDPTHDDRGFPSASRFRKKKSPENFREDGKNPQSYLNRPRYGGFSGRNQQKYIMESDVAPGQSTLLHSKISGAGTNTQMYQVKSKNLLNNEYTNIREAGERARGHRKVVSSGNEDKRSRENHKLAQVGKKFSSNRTTNLSELQNESITPGFEDQNIKIQHLKNELSSARAQLYTGRSDNTGQKSKRHFQSDRGIQRNPNFLSHRNNNDSNLDRSSRQERNLSRELQNSRNQAKYIYQNPNDTHQQQPQHQQVHLKQGYSKGGKLNNHLQKYNIKNVASIEKADSRFGSSRYNQALAKSREPTNTVNRFQPNFQISSESLGLDSRVYLHTDELARLNSQEIVPFGELGGQILHQIEELKEKYHFQKTKFKDFYRTTRNFIQEVQQQFHLVFTLMLDKETSQRRRVMVATQSQDRHVQRFFKKREQIFNELLHNMVFLVCTTKINATKSVLQSLFDAVNPHCPVLFIKETFETHINGLDNLIKGNVSDVQEVQAKIEHSITYFADKLQKVRVSTQFNASSFQVKAQIYSNKMGSRKGTVIHNSKGENDKTDAIRQVVVQMVVSNSEKFAELVLVQEPSKQTRRERTQEELEIMIENFEVYYRKINEAHNKVWELAITALSSVTYSGMEQFLQEFEKKINNIYCSENWSRARVTRRVHQILMSLEQLIVTQTLAMGTPNNTKNNSYLANRIGERNTRSRPKSPLRKRDRELYNNILYSRRNSELQEKPAHSKEALFTNFKILTKKLQNQVLRIIDKNPMGSVELLYGRIRESRHRLIGIESNTLIDLLKQSCQNKYELLIDTVFPKKKGNRNLSFVRQSNYRSNVINRQSGFLEQHSMVSDSGSHKNSMLVNDSSSGVLHDDKHFFNPTQAVLLHLLRSTRAFDALFFGDSFVI